MVDKISFKNFFQERTLQSNIVFFLFKYLKISLNLKYFSSWFEFFVGHPVNKETWQARDCVVRNDCISVELQGATKCSIYYFILQYSPASSQEVNHKNISSEI